MIVFGVMTKIQIIINQSFVFLLIFWSYNNYTYLSRNNLGNSMIMFGVMGYGMTKIQVILYQFFVVVNF